MKLSDVVGHSGLAGYAIVAMIIFMIAFVAIIVYLFWPSRRDALERHRDLPLSDEPDSPASDKTVETHRTATPAAPHGGSR